MAQVTSKVFLDDAAFIGDSWGFSLAGIQAVLAALLLITFRDGFWSGSGHFGQAWHPGIPAGAGRASASPSRQGRGELLQPHDDGGAEQVPQDEPVEGPQRPVSQEVAGQQAGACNQQVLLARLRPGANPDGVSSAQTTAAVMTSALISMFTPRTAFAARAIMECTNPSDGRAPVNASMIPAHRSTGTWCMTSRNTTQACRFSP
jgi:hypothetical protein